MMSSIYVSKVKHPMKKRGHILYSVRTINNPYSTDGHNFLVSSPHRKYSSARQQAANPDCKIHISHES